MGYYCVRSRINCLGAERQKHMDIHTHPDAYQTLHLLHDGDRSDRGTEMRPHLHARLPMRTVVHAINTPLSPRHTASPSRSFDDMSRPRPDANDQAAFNLQQHNNPNDPPLATSRATLLITTVQYYTVVHYRSLLLRSMTWLLESRRSPFGCEKFE